MIVTTYRIPYKYGDVFKLKPIADVHWGNKYCDKRALKEYLADSDGKTYFLSPGDLFDSIVVPDKRYRKHIDDNFGEDIIDQAVNSLHEVLKPYKKRIIGLGNGNHEEEYLKRTGSNPTKRLCELLGCEYLGYSWLLRLMFSQNGGQGRTVIVRGHHGWGGGSRTQGADLTKYSKDTTYWDADLFLYGHVHRKQSDRVPRLGLVGEKLVSKPKLIGICGTFLKTYSDTIDATYSEMKGYPPVEVGGITVNIKPHRQWVKMWIDV